jgi:DNA polymerase-3 subunit beta
MRFTISREKLQEGLSAVAASVPSKTTLPVLANILVEATDKGHSLVGHRPRHRRNDRSCGGR